MKTTIDRAGRLVIPKRFREQFHLSGGTAVEIFAGHDGLRLRPLQPTGRLIEKEGVLVQQADAVSSVDATEFINQQRTAHSLQNVSPEGGK